MSENEDLDDPGPLNRDIEDFNGVVTDSETFGDQTVNDEDEYTASSAESQAISDESEESESSDDEYVGKSLSEIIIEEIQQGIYTCLVCTLEIDGQSQVWSCSNCYRVYDLECIKDWAKRGTSTKDRKWRCPSCNVENNKIPNKFTCWCGKVENPSSRSLVPFSCGNVCGCKYQGCVHSCSSVCHPGDHPVCGAMGPLISCACGNHQRQVPCIITPYKHGWNCDDICGLEICDLGHKCPRPCHLGFCGPCQDVIHGKCFCGKHDLSIKCHEKYLQQCDGHIGISYCEETLEIYYDCGIHFDQVECQPIAEQVRVCKFSPSVFSTCYCGKTIATQRTKCIDPIPECNNICGKLLDCGDKCMMKCHQGPCECFAIKSSKCACNSYEYLISCKSWQQGFTPKCNHKCNALLNCRRHYHRDQCCEYEKVALDRERSRKKQLRNKLVSHVHQDIMSIESVHICTRPCNRLRLCGKHYCDALCHPGPCSVCLESTNEDLVCNCGKTIIMAPVRCGTKLVCTEQCVRSKACGHKPEIHECHELGNCPVCTERLSRMCECGRSQIPNVLCSGPVPKCSYICAELKKCGHECLSTCSKSCGQGIHSSTCRLKCNKVRTSCPHRCTLKCHYDKNVSCDEQVCEASVELKCGCGRITQTVTCGSSKTQVLNIGSKLHCDDECDKYKRDQELKQIFLGPETQEGIEKPQYTQYVVDTFIRQNNWCLRIEQILRNLVDNGHKKFHHFQPMNPQQRRFVHELAQVYNMYSESLDPEPKRTVFVYITPYTKTPMLTIQEYIDQINKENQIKLLNQELEQQKLAQELFNAILIQDVFIGVTEDKLVSLIEPHLQLFDLTNQLKMVYLNDFYLVYTPTVLETDDHETEGPPKREPQMSIEIENNLYLLMKHLRDLFRSKSIAFDCKLALVEDNKVLKIDSKLPKKEKLPTKLDNLENTFTVLEKLALDT